jgi:hypothetical protein
MQYVATQIFNKHHEIIIPKVASPLVFHMAEIGPVFHSAGESMTFSWPSFPSLQAHHSDVQTPLKTTLKKTKTLRPSAVTEKGNLKVRYCAYHEGDWDATDGEMRQMKRTARWICGHCLRLRAERAAKGID